MRYVDRVIGANERIVREAHLHWIIFGLPIACLVVATAFAFIFIDLRSTSNDGSVIAGFIVIGFGFFGLRILLSALIDWWTTEIAVTTRRVIYKRGLIRRHTIEINFNRVEGLDVIQTIAGRLLNYGTVDVRGTGLGEQPMYYVSAPIELRNAAFGEMQ